MNWYVKTFLLKTAHLFLKEHVLQTSVLASCFLFLQVNRGLKIWFDFKRSLEISIYIYFVLLIQNNYPCLWWKTEICIHVLVRVCTARIQVDNRSTGNFFIHSMFSESFLLHSENKKVNQQKVGQRDSNNTQFDCDTTTNRRRWPCESRRT